MLKQIISAISFGCFSAVILASDLAGSGVISDSTPPNVGRSVTGPGAQEGFENIDLLASEGWIIVNNSDIPSGPGWVQGDGIPYVAESGPDNSYITSYYDTTTGSQNSNWLILPDVGFIYTMRFNTRTSTGSIFADRLQVRYSPSGGTDTGGGPDTVGDFTDLLFDLNSGLTVGTYPEVWSGYNVRPEGTGRLAFRYFIPADGGPSGTVGQNVAIDSIILALKKPTISVTGGYIKLDIIANRPDSMECTANGHFGRMVYDFLNNFIYICTHTGWEAK